jgi:hypothetical protein
VAADDAEVHLAHQDALLSECRTVHFLAGPNSAVQSSSCCGGDWSFSHESIATGSLAGTGAVSNGHRTRAHSPRKECVSLSSSFTFDGPLLSRFLELFLVQFGLLGLGLFLSFGLCLVRTQFLRFLCLDLLGHVAIIEYGRQCG